MFHFLSLSYLENSIYTQFVRKKDHNCNVKFFHSSVFSIHVPSIAWPGLIFCTEIFKRSIIYTNLEEKNPF